MSYNVNQNGTLVRIDASDDKAGPYALDYGVFAGYISTSGNYVSFFIPLDKIPSNKTASISISSMAIRGSNFIYTEADIDPEYTPAISLSSLGLKVELKFLATKSSNVNVSVTVMGTLTIS